MEIILILQADMRYLHDVRTSFPHSRVGTREKIQAVIFF